MSKISLIKVGISKILAVAEKNIKIKLQYKSGLIISFFLPIFNIIMPIIILGQFFEYNAQFGQWTQDNFLVYQFVAYKIFLLQSMVTEYQSSFQQEKYWETLSALIIAPFNRFSLLIGLFISHLILILIPFTIFSILCFLYYPISFITLIFVLGIYTLVALVFHGIGIIFGIFSISLEKYAGIISFLYNIIFWLSCVSYPFEIFPPFIQYFINLNPLYYIFDIIRLAWIENNIVITIVSHPTHIFLLGTGAIIIPIISMYLFNKLYKKYGIVGY
jgi:ABC-type polysaccharide/polyol phosphate export permease